MARDCAAALEGLPEAGLPNPGQNAVLPASLVTRGGCRPAGSGDRVAVRCPPPPVPRNAFSPLCGQKAAGVHGSVAAGRFRVAQGGLRSRVL